MSHEEKYAQLLDAIEKAKNSPFQELLVPRPELLGETYEELVANLNRIADAGLRLSIAPRGARRGAGAAGPDDPPRRVN